MTECGSEPEFSCWPCGTIWPCAFQLSVLSHSPCFHAQEETRSETLGSLVETEKEKTMSHKKLPFYIFLRFQSQSSIDKIARLRTENIKWEQNNESLPRGLIHPTHPHHSAHSHPSPTKPTLCMATSMRCRRGSVTESWIFISVLSLWGSPVW